MLSVMNVQGRLVRFVAVRVASVASNVWLRAARLAVTTEVAWVPAPLQLVRPERQEVEPTDPLGEIDQTEIVSIVRRWDGDEGSVYVDYGEMDMDVALGLMLRGLFSLLLDDVLPVDADGED